MPDPASQQDIVTPHDDRAIGVAGGRSPGKRDHLNLRKALALVGRFELALIAKLHGRQKGGDVLLSQRGQFLVCRKLSVSRHQP
jgi:hypothetical protein